MRNVQRYSQNVYSWICRRIKNIQCKTVEGTVTNWNMYLKSCYFSCKTQWTRAVLDWAMLINGWFFSIIFFLYSIKICFCMKEMHSDLKQNNWPWFDSFSSCDRSTPLRFKLNVLNNVLVRNLMCVWPCIIHIQGVTGGTDQTSGGCSLC